MEDSRLIIKPTNE